MTKETISNKYDSDTYREDINLHLPKLKELAEDQECVVELGVDMGNGATQAFMDATGLKKLVSIDIRDNRLDWVKDKYNKAKNFHFYAGSSTDEELRDKIIKVHGTPSIVFVDTEHTEKQVRKELEVWSPEAIGEDVLYLFHDTYMHGRFHKINIAIDEFVEKYKLERVDLSKESHGLTAVSKKKTDSKTK